MGRWEPDSRGRLQEAALALYSERGFDQTTAAEVGMSVLRVAIERWANSDDDQSLPVIMKASMAELRAVTADS